MRAWQGTDEKSTITPRKKRTLTYPVVFDGAHGSDEVFGDGDVLDGDVAFDVASAQAAEEELQNFLEIFAGLADFSGVKLQVNRVTAA